MLGTSTILERMFLRSTITASCSPFTCAWGHREEAVRLIRKLITRTGSEVQ
jgi:hypothetical protein